MAHNIRQTRVCGICGAEFKPRSGRQKYCCEACSRKADYKHMREARERKKREHDDSINARLRADQRLGALAGSHPSDYAKWQRAGLIEQFARVRVIEPGGRTE